MTTTALIAVTLMAVGVVQLVVAVVLAAVCRCLSSDAGAALRRNSLSPRGFGRMAGISRSRAAGTDRYGYALAAREQDLPAMRTERGSKDSLEWTQSSSTLPVYCSCSFDEETG